MVSGKLHVPTTHWIGYWVGPRAGQDAVMKRKKKHYNCPCRELSSGRPIRSLVTVLTELPPFITLTEVKSKQQQFTPKQLMGYRDIRHKFEAVPKISGHLVIFC